MIEFYIKVPENKEEFFSRLIDELGYRYEKHLSMNDDGNEIDFDENFFTDSDD